MIKSRYMELLAKLLGGNERVKIMRFFLHHDESVFSLSYVAEKTKSKDSQVKKEITLLNSIGFIERKKARTIVNAGKKNEKVKEIIGYKLNSSFPHNQALKDLLFDFELLDKRELASRFRNVGRIKLFVLGGVFVGQENSRIDILLVGEAIKKQKAEKVFDVISSEMGRDVTYSIMDVEEYEYRFRMYDKFIRDIIDAPHDVVIDKITEKIKY